jgi:protein-S-isoprenylcysteine O-methyltransferase Ste14
MEELDLLKKDWKKQEANQPKLSYNDIDKMTHKKSSSLVKWIFYVSLFELGFGVASVIVMFLLKPEVMEDSNTPIWFNWFYYFTSVVVFYFIYRFFIEYKKISTTSSIKGLMQNIITTRKTVKHYVMFSLSAIAFTVCVAVPSGFIAEAGGMEKFSAEATLSSYLVLAVVTIFIACLIVLVFYVIYYLLYGLLTKKLKRNYKELEKLKS